MLYRLCCKRQTGFTLIELMITLVVLALLLAIGLPSFANFMRTTQVDAASNDLGNAMRYARSEAIQRNLSVAVVPAAAVGYQDGWSVCADADSDGTWCEAGESLRVHEALENVAVVCAGIACTDRLDFNSRGMGESASITITHAGDAALVRCVRVLLSGSVSVTDAACP